MQVIDFPAKCKGLELKKKIVDGSPYQVQSIVLTKMRPEETLYTQVSDFHNRRTMVKLEHWEEGALLKSSYFIGIVMSIKFGEVKEEGESVPRITITIEIFRPESRLFNELPYFRGKMMSVRMEEPDLSATLDDIPSTGVR